MDNFNGHKPVMLKEVLACLNPQDNETYVDATFGGGGYTQSFLEAAACQVIAFDRDPEAVRRAHTLKSKFGERLKIIESPFGDMADQLKTLGISKVNGIVFDLGISSYQIDTPERGFSLRFEGPLSMRMDASPHATNAADIVNTYDENEIADILYYYGDERKSRQIARAIVKARSVAPFETTRQLAEVVKAVLPQKSAEHPATRTFQALRIFVNDELGELKKALLQSANLLTPGGRLVVVTFHSLEDRIIKEFLQPSRMGPASRYLPEVEVFKASSIFKQIYKKPLQPSAEEVSENPRARSAKLRAAIYQGENPQ